MKANKAPDKIYRTTMYLENDKGNTLWKTKPVAGAENIEYIRKDAFIEKAYEWLKTHYRDYMHNPTGKRLEAFFGGDMCNDFEDYMKGE